MNSSIRAFFAVEIKNKKLIYAIRKLQEELTGIMDQIKLVEPENIHITIRFLGHITEPTARKLYEFLQNDINSHYFQNGPLEFTVRRLGDFSKRVFHLGIQGPVSTLREIHDKIDNKLVESFGFPKDRKLKTHITIARAKKSKNRQISTNLPLKEFQTLKNDYVAKELGSFQVGKIFLKKSVLTPQGPIYSNLEF
ncbi:MAG: RNA 2',3'-cyclic phosphodiesterase [Candidatus Lokiarchaeota archaeon]|nr:RNA 2',3'-cyclic phosphodiesterase [Candidatus Lokiarchaeota archaeon]